MSTLSTASCVEPLLGLVNACVACCYLFRNKRLGTLRAMGGSLLRSGAHAIGLSAIFGGDDIGLSVLFDAHAMLDLGIKISWQLWFLEGCSRI